MVNPKPKEARVSETEFSSLQRPSYPMPDFVQEAREARELMARYRSRPAYQQNDYIGWITRAKREETVQKRLTQMLNELERDDTYMKMRYHAHD